MQAIYSKILAAEEHLHRIRLMLEASEEAYKINGKAIITPSTLAAVTMPFIDSAYASAKAAELSCAGTVKHQS